MRRVTPHRRAVSGGPGPPAVAAAGPMLPGGLPLAIPAAWLGGYLQLPGWFFIGLLAMALLVAGIFLLFSRPEKLAPVDSPLAPAADVLTGGALGLLAGMTGIGGGIYLAPLLYWRRWAAPATIAATCAFFILVNSLAGLAGQAMKLGSHRQFIDQLPEMA